MSNLSEIDAPTAPAVTVAASDRRRPGRLASISPELVPLLRGQLTPAEMEPQFGEPDQLAATRGLAFGLLLSLPLWAAIGLVGRWLFA